MNEICDACGAVTDGGACTRCDEDRADGEAFARTHGMPWDCPRVTSWEDIIANWDRWTDKQRIAVVRTWLGGEAGMPASALPDDEPQPRGSESWPQDALHGRVRDVLRDMRGVVPAARRALRQGLDEADAGPQGRARSDEALGRALGFLG